MPTNGRAGAGHAIELDQPFGFTPQVIGVGFRHLRLDQVAGFQAVETLQEDMAVDLRCVTTGAGDGGAVVADVIDQTLLDAADLAGQLLR